MENAHKTYHDKEIVNIYHDKKNRILRLLTLDDDEIKFENIIQIELNYFSEQNVIFDIHEYNLVSIPQNLKEEYPFLNNNRLSNDFKYYHLDSSTGLTGFIVCS